MRGWFWAMALAAGVVGALGCSEDPPTGAGTQGTGSGGGGASSSGTDASASSGAGAGSSGRCVKGCAAAAECCAGDPQCPSSAYPHNPTCESGHCRPGQCSATSDCTALGPNLDCLLNNDFKACGIVCATDTDCPQNTTCTGTDANGKKFCKGMSTSKECSTDADCTGRGRCADGSCVCDADDDCTATGVDKCLK
ncbi:hypothetical protein [Polyangium aurulentum]|uniref:hypothetical protein n=1 Tax=Polyangium aurulentum TaxID=2567896 RepID=UPI0010AE18F9|nr:hypothetical protein [Polyangium aurulentum]UQA55187.1 hypothetical protein E8A73_028015 [Polyangium aurulentum]